MSYAKTYPKYKDIANKVKIISTGADKYYGSGYQDVKSRVPSIKNAQKYLGWNPKTSISDALKKTVNFYFGEN